MKLYFTDPDSRQCKLDCVSYHKTDQLHLTCAVYKDGQLIYKPCLLNMNYSECPDFIKRGKNAKLLRERELGAKSLPVT